MELEQQHMNRTSSHMHGNRHMRAGGLVPAAICSCRKMFTCFKTVETNKKKKGGGLSKKKQIP